MNTFTFYSFAQVLQELEAIADYADITQQSDILSKYCDFIQAHYGMKKETVKQSAKRIEVFTKVQAEAVYTIRLISVKNYHFVVGYYDEK